MKIIIEDTRHSLPYIYAIDNVQEVITIGTMTHIYGPDNKFIAALPNGMGIAIYSEELANTIWEEGSFDVD